MCISSRLLLIGRWLAIEVKNPTLSKSCDAHHRNRKLHSSTFIVRRPSIFRIEHYLRLVRLTILFELHSNYILHKNVINDFCVLNCCNIQFQICVMYILLCLTINSSRKDKCSKEVGNV